MARTVKKKKKKNYGKAILAFLAIAALIAVIVIFVGGIFKNKSYEHELRTEAVSEEEAVRKAQTILIANVEGTGEVIREILPSPITSKDGTEHDSVYYTTVILGNREVLCGSDKNVTYELGGTYDGAKYTYDNAASFVKGEHVLLLLDADGFLIGENVGKYYISNDTYVTSAADPASVRTLDGMMDFIAGLRDDITLPTPTASAGPTAAPTETPPTASAGPTAAPTETPDPTPAPTSVVIEETVESMTSNEAFRRCSLVVRAAVISRGKATSTVSEGNSYVYTPVNVQVKDVLYGSLGIGDDDPFPLITVRQLGGTVDGKTYIYYGEPNMEAGEDVVLVLDASRSIVGGNAGKYSVHTVEGQEYVTSALDADISLPWPDFVIGMMSEIDQ